MTNTDKSECEADLDEALRLWESLPVPADELGCNAECGCCGECDKWLRAWDDLRARVKARREGKA